MEPQYIGILVQIIAASIATFFAILLWPKTHDSSWMLVIAGLVVNYVGVIVSSLEVFGLSQLGSGSNIPGLVLLNVIKNIPYLLYATGLYLAYRDKAR